MTTCKCVHPSEPAPSLIPVSVLVLVPVQVFCTLYSRATRPIRIAPPPRFPSAGPLITASTRAFTDSHVDLQLARLCCALPGAQGLAGTPDRELLNTYLARPRPWQRHALDARLHCGLNSLKVFNGLFCTPSARPTTKGIGIGHRASSIHIRYGVLHPALVPALLYYLRRHRSWPGAVQALRLRGHSLHYTRVIPHSSWQGLRALHSTQHLHVFPSSVPHAHAGTTRFSSSRLRQTCAQVDHTDF